MYLICSAGGYPAPEVQWKKNTVVLVEGFDSSATIRKSNVELTDEGTYVCGASNAAGKRVESIKLSVRPSPPLQYKASLGDGARLSCEIEQSRRTLSWKRQDGLPLPNNSKFSGSDLVRILWSNFQSNYKYFFSLNGIQMEINYFDRDLRLLNLFSTKTISIQSNGHQYF